MTLEQTIFQKGNYDCFHTALACITGEDVEAMPEPSRHFVITQLELEPWERWQLKYGWMLRWFLGDKNYKKGEYYVGLYKLTFLDSSHAVVCKDGSIVHNVQENANNSNLYPHPWGIVTVNKYKGGNNG